MRSCRIRCQQRRTCFHGNPRVRYREAFPETAHAYLRRCGCCDQRASRKYCTGPADRFRVRPGFRVHAQRVPEPKRWDFAAGEIRNRHEIRTIHAHRQIRNGAAHTWFVRSTLRPPRGLSHGPTVRAGCVESHARAALHRVQLLHVTRSAERDAAHCGRSAARFAWRSPPSAS